MKGLENLILSTQNSPKVHDNANICFAYFNVSVEPKPVSTLSLELHQSLSLELLIRHEPLTSHGVMQIYLWHQ